MFFTEEDVHPDFKGCKGRVELNLKDVCQGKVAVRLTDHHRPPVLNLGDVFTGQVAKVDQAPGVLITPQGSIKELFVKLVR